MFSRRWPRPIFFVGANEPDDCAWPVKVTNSDVKRTLAFILASPRHHCTAMLTGELETHSGAARARA